MPAITATISLRLPGPLLEQIDARASEAGMSRNAWLVALLSTYSEMLPGLQAERGLGLSEEQLRGGFSAGDDSGGS